MVAGVAHIFGAGIGVVAVGVDEAAVDGGCGFESAFVVDADGLFAQVEVGHELEAV